VPPQQRQPQDFPLQVTVFILLVEVVVRVLAQAIRALEVQEAARQVWSVEALVMRQAEFGTLAAAVAVQETHRHLALAVLVW
jgi:hypothetical protein